jgi:hypothetical protein
MKQYKHKQTGWIAFKRCDNEYNIYTKAENFLFQTAKELIENTNDWEEIKPEPKYKVEDWVKDKDNIIGKIIKILYSDVECKQVNYDIVRIGGELITRLESQIKCKVKPVKLQFGLCKNKMGYYIPQTYFYVNTSTLNNSDYHSTHSITVYEEVEDET